MLDAKASNALDDEELDPFIHPYGPYNPYAHGPGGYPGYAHGAYGYGHPGYGYNGFPGYAGVDPYFTGHPALATNYPSDLRDPANYNPAARWGSPTRSAA